MGMLEKVRSTLSVFRDDILNRNSNTFDNDYGSNTYFKSYRFHDIYLTLSLKGANIDLIEEPKNVIALGIPLVDVSISTFSNVSTEGSEFKKYNENDVKFEIRNDFTYNKSDSHMILFRIDYNKNYIDWYWDDSVRSFKRNKDNLNLYSISSFRNFSRLSNFNFKRYLTVYIKEKKNILL